MGKGNHTDRGVAGGRISIKSGGIPAESSVLSRQGGSEQSARQIDSERGDKAMLARFEAVALPHFDAIYRLARALAASDFAPRRGSADRRLSQRSGRQAG